jgi:alpha-1,2-mannosyltransferase
MLQLVWDRRPTYNNDTKVVNSTFSTYAKLLYYAIFASAYAVAGSLCSLVMVNSSWTRSHISSLWRVPRQRLHTLFPPCDTDTLKDLSLDRRVPIIVSIGQFRPEKDHMLQIKSLETLIRNFPKWKDAKLVMIGSCRGAEDEWRVNELQNFISSLGLHDSVEFVLNQPYSVVKEWLAKASIGIHTMWNEHFGIGVVEMMAAGLLVIAHNSGGPKQDILVPFKGKQIGYLAKSDTEFAFAMNEALSLSPSESRMMRALARQASMKFSDQAFMTSFKKIITESSILIASNPVI